MSSEFIYLMPGNWYELKNIKKDKCYPYDIESFKFEIINQISNRAEHLGIINASYGNFYKNITSQDIDFYVDEDKLSRMNKYLENETRHPIITFHGSNQNNVYSIINNGYSIPGIDNDNPNKVTVGVANGSMYGHGVYTSPFFDKAISYSRKSSDGYIYLIVNIVFVGKLKLIPVNNSLTDKSRPVDGAYADGSTTRMVFGLDQLISADSDRVIPVAVIKTKV